MDTPTVMRVYLNPVRMDRISSGSPVKLTHYTLSRGHARGRVSQAYKPGLRTRGFAQWMKPDQSAAPDASSSLEGTPSSSTTTYASAA